jgi:hypothetical protein
MLPEWSPDHRDRLPSCTELEVSSYASLSPATMGWLTRWFTEGFGWNTAERQRVKLKAGDWPWTGRAHLVVDNVRLGVSTSSLTPTWLGVRVPNLDDSSPYECRYHQPNVIISRYYRETPTLLWSPYRSASHMELTSRFGTSDSSSQRRKKKKRNFRGHGRIFWLISSVIGRLLCDPGVCYSRSEVVEISPSLLRGKPEHEHGFAQSSSLR